MTTNKVFCDNNATIRFAVKNYFDGEISQAAEKTGYSQSQIKKWINNEIKPRTETTRYFMGVALIPEFKIVCEHHSFDCEGNISDQLKEMLNSHSKSPGIYVFYDSL
ncbi:helix-turn-helix domain-containing protein, partial [Phytobacter sp. V91]|uniref:helix-turn-helix domain-containing protein n=1 Tax=Phytobacter sp. V91 TaxID=3369425 RepID=UPI003F618B8C